MSECSKSQINVTADRDRIEKWAKLAINDNED